MFDFQNNKALSLKKHISQLVGAKISSHDEILDRVATILVTDADMQKFADLIGDIYQSSYSKCVSDHRKELEKLGIRSSVKAELAQSSK